MQYALMIYAEPGYNDGMSDADRKEVTAEFEKLTEDARSVTGMQLAPVETATSVRVVGGKTLMTDGPFADTKEVLGGLYLIEAAHLDDAVDMAARVPVARLGGVVEIRPVVPR
jgi:hypothetical protein